MADIVALAQDIWDEAQEDASLLATLKSERSALSQAIRQGTTVGDIINASKNGGTFSMRVNFSVQDRLAALRMAIQGIETNIRPSRTSRAYFLR